MNPYFPESKSRPVPVISNITTHSTTHITLLHTCRFFFATNLCSKEVFYYTLTVTDGHVNLDNRQLVIELHELEGSGENLPLDEKISPRSHSLSLILSRFLSLSLSRSLARNREPEPSEPETWDLNPKAHSSRKFWALSFFRYSALSFLHFCMLPDRAQN